MNEPAKVPTPLWKLKLKSLVSEASKVFINEIQHTGSLLTEIAKTAYTTKANDVSDSTLANILRSEYGVTTNSEILRRLNIHNDSR